MSLKINILLSTIDAGIENVKNVILPVRNDVDYIISHQYRNEKFNYTPKELQRQDIIVSHIPGYGVTKSRNNAINIAKGDIGLFADDDVTYKNEYFDTLQKVFSDDSKLDVALFKIKTPAGEPEYKAYRNFDCDLSKPLHSIGTIEIAFRIKSIRKNKILFDERFGAGNDLMPGSDENIFVIDCIRDNLKVKYFAEYIVEHPYISSINKIPKYDKRLNWVVGGYDCRVNGKIAIVKAFGGTVKLLPDLLKHRINPLVYLRDRLSAVFYILRTT